MEMEITHCKSDDKSNLSLLFCFVVCFFCIDISKMISNATSSVNKMRDDLKKIANDVGLQLNICI